MPAVKELVDHILHHVVAEDEGLLEEE